MANEAICAGGGGRNSDQASYPTTIERALAQASAGSDNRPSSSLHVDISRVLRRIGSVHVNALSQQRVPSPVVMRVNAPDVSHADVASSTRGSSFEHARRTHAVATIHRVSRHYPQPLATRSQLQRPATSVNRRTRGLVARTPISLPPLPTTAHPLVRRPSAKRATSWRRTPATALRGTNLREASRRSLAPDQLRDARTAF